MQEFENPDQWKRLEELFYQALEMPASARAQFLDDACGGDAGLRRKLQSMLDATSRPGDLLTPALETAARDLLTPRQPEVLQPGAGLGRYRIVSLLGEGGMGRVYRARDTRLDRDVAIKVLASGIIQSSRSLLNFEQEARTASALNHPNILTIHEVGELQGTRFIVSEFIDGPTLAKRLAAGPLDAAAALDVAIQVASGLVAAHAAGIVHRDIKPENLLLRGDGLIKIVDFGIAKLSEERRLMQKAATAVAHGGARTHTGTIIGTVRYMSPEQARGQNVDGRTDVFSLGTVIYEMVAGRAPFDGDTDSDVVAEILKTEPPPLGTAASGVPPQLARIVARALRKNRDERQESAAELLAELTNLREDLRFRARLSTFEWRPRRTWTRRAALAALLLGAGAGAVYYARRGPSPSSGGKPRSLAILPFHNIGPDPDTDFLGFSLADAIITKLGPISALTVRPSSAIEKYRNRQPDPRQAGSDLGVDTLLTGSYIKEGGDLRITAQLVDLKTLNILWRDTIDVPYNNLIAVNDNVAAKIISNLELNLTPAEAQTLKLDNPIDRTAYEDYLRGVDLYAMNDFETSIVMLEKSAGLDPSYAPTWTHLGRAYEANASLQFGGRAQYAKARAAYQKALQLDPGSIEPRVYMANLLTDTGSVEDAVPLLLAALARNRNAALAHWELGYAYRFGGLLEDSVRECELARRIDPSVKIASSAINAYFYLGRYDQWLASLPDNNSAYILFYRGFGEFYKGDPARAAAHFDRAYDLDPALLQADIGKALSDQIAHNNAAGIQLLREVERRILDRGVTDPEGIYKVAQAYAVLGDKPAALRLFQQTVQGGFVCYPYFQNDPLIDDLRREPRFAQLMEEARKRSQRFRDRFAPKPQ